MYNNQNGIVTGAKWLFWLAIIILAAVFALGLNIKDAKWLNGDIASATAEQINVTTDVERKKSELDLQLLETQTEIQIAEQKRQAEYEAVKQQQEFEAAALAEAQKAEFRSDFYNVLNNGLMILFAAISIVATVAGINASVGLRSAMNRNTEALRVNEVRVSVSDVNRREPSLAAQQARLREQADRRSKIRAERIDKMLKNTEAIWSVEDRKSDKFSSSNNSRAS